MVDTPEYKPSVAKETADGFVEIGRRAVGVARDILGTPTLPKPASPLSSENMARYAEISKLRTQEVLATKHITHGDLSPPDSGTNLPPAA